MKGDKMVTKEKFVKMYSSKFNSYTKKICNDDVNNGVSKKKTKKEIDIDMNGYLSSIYDYLKKEFDDDANNRIKIAVDSITKVLIGKKESKAAVPSFKPDYVDSEDYDKNDFDTPLEKHAR